MLSFFRKKSAGSIDAPTVDGIIPKMEQLSTAQAAVVNGTRTATPTTTTTTTAATSSPQRHHDASACEEAIDSSELVHQLGYGSCDELRETIYDILRTIKDPEKPQTLEDLNVVYEEGVFVKNPTSDNVNVIRVEFNPTVPHCSLATLIGLCIRVKIERSIPHQLKLDIYIKKGTHTTEDEINKQINDKERIAAAMENPNLRTLVEDCIKEED